MTDEQLEELKDVIIGVVKILDGKVEQIAFKLDDLRREMDFMESTVSEVRDQLFLMIQEME
jgi:hypothetical protein